MRVHVRTATLPTSLGARERVARQRAVADVLLRAAAAAAGRPALRFERDPEGAPVASDGWHHSIANTPGLVAVALAPGPVGVDAEHKQRPRLAAARAYLADDLLQLGRDDDDTLLFAWCSREAAVKAAGIGIAGMPALRRRGPNELEYAGAQAPRRFRVERIPYPTHVLVVATALSKRVDYGPLIDHLDLARAGMAPAAKLSPAAKLPTGGAP